MQDEIWLTLSDAAAQIQAGGVIAYPTEAVFGLGCDPLNETAVRRLLAIKQRPEEKGLILLADDAAQLSGWVTASEDDWQTMQARWPGPVTFLVPVTPKVPRWITGKHRKVAVRVCGHPLARELALAANTPIVSTSANLAGEPSHREAGPLHQQLGNQLDGILPGECNLSDHPSTIIDLETRAVIRP